VRKEVMSAIGGKYEFYLEELKNKEMTVQLLKLLDADAYGFFHN
jgi:hypothetical protein